MKNINYFVLDANTLISAFLLSSTSITAKAYYKAKSEGKIVMSEETFNEFSDVFIRPKFDRYIPLNKRLTIIEDLRNVVKFVIITKTINICRDPKDSKYLELAVSSGALFIVTGDKDLLVLHSYEDIQIITPADFVNNG